MKADKDKSTNPKKDSAPERDKGSIPPPAFDLQTSPLPEMGYQETPESSTAVDLHSPELKTTLPFAPKPSNVLSDAADYWGEVFSGRRFIPFLSNAHKNQAAESAE